MLQQQHLPLFSCGRVRCVWFADSSGLVSKQLDANASAYRNFDVNVVFALSEVIDNNASFLFFFFKLARFSDI